MGAVSPNRLGASLWNLKKPGHEAAFRVSTGQKRLREPLERLRVRQEVVSGQFSLPGSEDWISSMSAKPKAKSDRLLVLSAEHA